MSKYIESRIDNNRYCKTNGQFTRHLRIHNLTYQEYYEKYVTGKKELCVCGNSKTFYQASETYANSCGDPKCVGNTIHEVKSNWSQEKRLQDSENKKQAASRRTPEQIQKINSKSKATQIARYGDLVTRTKQFKDKAKKTKLERYGNEYYSGWEKSAAANRNKSQQEQNEINNRRRQTNLELYGVECCLMRPEIRIKSGLGNSKGKEYVLPSGRVIGVRGFENIVLDVLLKTYDESQILMDDRKTTYSLPVFEYINVNQHKQNYYPDIYLPDENRIIEVKSQWWWDGNGDDRYKGRLENNYRKAQSVAERGYDYEVWLFADKKTYEIIQWT